MTVIVVTGSIGSGKSTAAEYMSKKKYPLFSADQIVDDLYRNNKFANLLVKKFNLKKKGKIKQQIKSIIVKNKANIKSLEKITHPLVRQKMNTFLKKKDKILILEIPLLIENKLNKHFDKIIFIDTKKKLRLKRYLKKHNDKKTFEILDQRQLKPSVKKKFCNLIINNNYTLLILKKNIERLIKIYE